MSRLNARGCCIALVTTAVTAVSAINRGPSTKPHIITLVIDDLGWHDTQIHNPESFMTGNFGDLAKNGIVLNRHHTYKVCSPTRRSILSGRFPVHITGEQAPICSNYLPLEFTLLPAKLKTAGYQTHMVGKGHLGYQTTDHLPVHRGFDSHVGYLHAAEDYHWGNTGDQGPGLCEINASDCRKDMWENFEPGYHVVDQIFYSANFYASRAVELIQNHNRSMPFYLHQTFQSVHAPFEDPPVSEQIPSSSVPSRFWDQTWGSMLNAVDNGVGNITNALRAAGMWDNTLIVMTADNGGDCQHGQPANNFPLKGRKCTSWDGGTRVSAMVSGGFIPEELRGSSSDILMHVADWYATLATLVGIDPSDPAKMPTGVFDIDGVNMWPAITGANTTNPRPWLPITEDSIEHQLNAGGDVMKLLVNAKQTNLFSANGLSQPVATDPCVIGDNVSSCVVCSPKSPCLYNVEEDPSESTNLASDPSKKNLVQQMAAKLSSFTPYVDGTMTAAALAKYDCTATPDRLWGSWTGPCCVPKK